MKKEEMIEIEVTEEVNPVYAIGPITLKESIDFYIQLFVIAISWGLGWVIFLGLLGLI